MKHKSILHKLTAALLCCTGMTVQAFSADDAKELPARFDWREADPPILTPVKNQVGGTCWAYATIGCAEANLALKGLADNSIDLSETHLIWFTLGQGAPLDSDDPRYGSGRTFGTKAYNTGSNHVEAIASLVAWQGFANEEDVLPHSEKPALDESLRYNSVAHLQNALYFSYNREKTSQYIKHLIMETGPVLMSYSHIFDHTFSEKSGYYNPNYNSQKSTGSKHAVMIVGWDDHFSKSDFIEEPPGDGAWIVRNSWGNSKDYFYMSYYERSIEGVASFDCESSMNYGSNYSYHGSDLNNIPTPGTQYGFYTANIFEAEKTEKLAAAGCYLIGFTSDPKDYELSVYLLNPDPSDPQDGTLVYKTKGTKEKNGFYTMKFPESIAVDKGQQYSVILKTSIGNGCYFDGGCYKKGASYYAYYTANSTGEKQDWKDCYENELGDACLHVYTEYEGETEQFIRGDVNRDGKVNAVDLTLLKQVLLGSDRTDIDRKAADCNGDNAINAEDA
ncbi:MAG: hypothetical protein J6Z40_13785, partial [Oscillospiraceae bacterium]|nr:hypothetical protein [Oscillospiraceae bacterium]